MADADDIAAIIAAGYGFAAAELGQPIVQIRPTTATLPLQQPSHATPVAFFDQDAQFSMRKPWSQQKQGGTEGYAALDTTDVRPGDLLVGADTYFVSRVEPIRPCQVVLTDTIFDVLSEITEREPGYNGQRGPTTTSRSVIATGWPGSMRAGGRSESDPARLPTDARATSWSILLPPIPGVVIERQTLLRTGSGQILQVSAANLDQFGYRLLAVEAVV